MKALRLDRRIGLSRILLSGWREVPPASSDRESLAMVEDEIETLTNLTLKNPYRAVVIVALIEEWQRFADSLRSS